MKNNNKIVLTIAALAAVFLWSGSANAEGDTTTPVITSFAVAPKAADASAQDQTFTVAIHITDDQSGVCVSGDCGNDYVGTPTYVRFQSIGTEVLDFYNFNLISGNANDGVFSSIASLNSTTIGNSAEDDSVTIDSEYSIINPMNGDKVTFPQGTVIMKKEGGNFAFYQMLIQDYEFDEVTDSGLAGFPLSTLRIGVPGLNLSFSKPVEIELQFNDLRDKTKLKIQSLGENSDQWANETTCTIEDEACQFTVSHATRFAILGKKKIKLSVKKIPKRTTNTTVSVRGKTKKGASVSVSVNSLIQKTLTAGKGGRYNTTIDLESGLNTIRIMAGNSKGSKTVTKRV